MAVVVKAVLGSHFGDFGEFTNHFRLPILVVGLGCLLGTNRAFDPCYRETRRTVRVGCFWFQG